MRAMSSSARDALAAIVGEGNVSDILVDRICYSRDCGPDRAGIPGLVVRPGRTEEVAAIVRLANELRMPLFVRGRATAFLGSGVTTGSIVMETTRLDRIDRVDAAAGWVRVGAGAIWHSVDTELRRLGRELAVPGGGGLFSCTVGGSVALNAIPHAITEYGMTGDHVLSLEVVLPQGEIILTGSAANPGSDPVERYANGPDLTGLFLGSYGILGVITSVTYRIRKVPEAEAFAMYAFDDYLEAIDAGCGIQTQEAATFLVGLFGGPHPAGVTGDAFLHVIVRGASGTTGERMGKAKAICEVLGGRPASADGTQNYWREHMYSWLRNTGPGAYYSDRPYFCPEVAGFVSTQGLKKTIDLFRVFVREHQAEFTQFGIRIKGVDVYFSRNGAYLWIDTLYDERRDDAWEYGVKLRARLADLMFGEGGMSPGGIGAGLTPLIMPRLGNYAGLLRTLKKALDPNGILNPGVLVSVGDRP